MMPDFSVASFAIVKDALATEKTEQCWYGAECQGRMAQFQCEVDGNVSPSLGTGGKTRCGKQRPSGKVKRICGLQKRNGVVVRSWQSISAPNGQLREIQDEETSPGRLEFKTTDYSYIEMCSNIDFYQPRVSKR
jgi:hypothetical protein